MFSTLSFLSFLLAQREVLRENLSRLIYFSMFILIAGGALWMVFSAGGTGVQIATRHETSVAVNWYFMTIVIVSVLLLTLLLVIRKMYYNVEYSIIAMNPSTARSVMALHGALYKGTPDEQSDVLERIDSHVAGVRGRRRGLLNFPFWLLEHPISLLYGLRPNFFAMDAQEQRYYLRKYILRLPQERDRSVIPNAAHGIHNIGTAFHAFITLGHYSLINEKHKIGYVPPDARDRLQGDYPSGPPPFKKTARIPDGPKHPANWKPENKQKGKPLVAPRVVTPVDEPHIPDEVDYLIVGSGAGGAVMAYRLGKRDIEHIKYAFETVIEIGHSAEGVRAVVPTNPGIDIKLTRKNIDVFKKALRNYALQKNDLNLMTAHPQGGNRMAGDSSEYKPERVVDDRFKVDGLDNVYVSDASVFPEGITINPQWTIMSMSSLAAKSVLGGG